jgi:hypothetical protein
MQSPRASDPGHTTPENPMPDNNDTPTLLVWTRPDGTTMTGEKDSVMAAYWQAGKVGTLREQSNTPREEPPAPVVAKADDWQPAAVSRSWDDVTVDEGKAQKITERAEAIKAAGFALPDPWFAPGTRMMQIGVDTYKATYAEWAERPAAEDAMRAVAQRIREERRTDYTVRIGDLRMDNDGCLGRKGGPARPIEHSAWGRVYSALQGVGVLPDGVRLLESLDPATRALVVNERLAALDPDKEVQIGVRRNPTGGWSVFRVTSTRYPTDGQADVILDGMADRIAGLDWRGSVLYDTGSTDVRFDATTMASPASLDPAVGDVFRAGVKGSTNDAAGGRFVITPFAGRIICINCTMMDAYAPGYSRIHRGSMVDALDASEVVVSKAVSILPMFVDDWSVLRDTTVTAMPWERVVGRKSAEEVEDVPTALRALVHAGRVDHGTARDALVEHLLASYAAEPGNGTVADVINAVTRAAHERLVDQCKRDTLERQAGALVPAFARIVTGQAAEAR